MGAAPLPLPAHTEPTSQHCMWSAAGLGKAHIPCPMGRAPQGRCAEGAQPAVGPQGTARWQAQQAQRAGSPWRARLPSACAQTYRARRSARATAAAHSSLSGPPRIACCRVQGREAERDRAYVSRAGRPVAPPPTPVVHTTSARLPALPRCPPAQTLAATIPMLPLNSSPCPTRSTCPARSTFHRLFAHSFPQLSPGAQWAHA